jgi:hypothetical protein
MLRELISSSSHFKGCSIACAQWPRKEKAKANNLGSLGTLAPRFWSELGRALLTGGDGDLDGAVTGEGGGEYDGRCDKGPRHPPLRSLGVPNVFPHALITSH